MLPTGETVLGAAAIGAATGILSQTGPAAVLGGSSPRQLPSFLRSPWARRLALASAGGEIAANAAIPSLPPRTDPGPLGGRIMFGAGSAALLARTQGQPVVAAAVVGGVAAALSATTATTIRARLSRFVPDPLVAVAETLLAVTLARKVTRP